jgi:hypothetical protein
MKTLKDYFSTTSLGYENAKELTKNIREFIKDKYNIKVKTSKKSYTARTGGAVTGGNDRFIEVNIESKEKFDISDFINNFNKCRFVYENTSRGSDWSSQFQSYIIEIRINNITCDIGSKYHNSFVDNEMLSSEVFDGISRTDYYINNKEKLNKIYFQKITSDFIIDYNIKFKTTISENNFLELVSKLTNSTMNIFNIIIKRNKYINDKLTVEECKNLTWEAKHLRLEPYITQQVVDYLLSK